jgi:hypothetical protein
MQKGLRLLHDASRNVAHMKYDERLAKNLDVAGGGHLERSQRFGILPTMTFWNRRDVWRTGRWFVAPVVGLSVAAGTLLHMAIPTWSVPVTTLLFGALPPLAVMGGVERYIRRKRRERSGY